MYKLMIIEDDSGIANSIKSQALSWEFDVYICEDYRNVVAETSNYSPHLILLDIGLPFFNGYHWCNEIRKVSNVPIIIISSASNNMSIVMSMNMGADDFVAKPFDLNVLMAKINALLRRTYGFSSTLSVIEHNGVILNTDEYTISFKHAKIELTKNEYRILLTLMENKGSVVSREKLMEKLWESDYYVDDNTLTVNVNRLRKKLESIGIFDFIQTKFGVGYNLRGE